MNHLFNNKLYEQKIDSTVKILGIHNRKYFLEMKNLRSVLETAQVCDYVSIISVIGQDCYEKNFLVNCIINYLNCEHKDSWPKCSDAIITNGKISCIDSRNDRPIVKITSKPIILTENIANENKTIAVFLMDSEYIFDKNMGSKISRDIIGLFLLTSSTLIYSRNDLIAV